jgi:FtsP/CotA-like multicopper oxidase with cupredoxin domain
MTRRALLALACGWTSAVATTIGQHKMEPRPAAPSSIPPDGNADITLRIAETTLDLAPGRSIRTLAYNGQVPGPFLRAPQGKPLIVDVWNDSKDEEIVHWHGFHIPSDVDGAFEEGTPGVPPNGGHRRYAFTPNPAGTRWYHSHTSAGRNLRKSTYSGQFGAFIVDGANDPGAFDREVPILLHEWDARFASQGAMDVEFKYFSINGRMLGAADPIRVKPFERVLFRIVNASATLHHRLALPGHVFSVIALDGNTVPTPARVPILDLGPGERIDAIVEMNRPGIWIFGEVRTEQRTAGMGIVVEYANQTGAAQWARPDNYVWDYTVFGHRTASAPEPNGRLTMVFKAADDGHRWTINGKSYPRIDPIVVEANKRYRWTLDNQSADAHPVHLHRHMFELVRVAGQPVSGVWKDVVMVPAWKEVEVDVPTTQPGLTLFHCHQQWHMDMGFMAMMKYSGV